jgi:gamma-glutamyltranspeptidase/glutathione hydrolase
MVCSADHLATQAGVRMLAGGGSAGDAAIAANAVLAVTAPHLCGLGGDLFALVATTGQTEPAALNASGRAGAGADPERLRAEGWRVMPFQGDVRSVTVPGCVDGWLALHQRTGRLPLADVLAPAIAYSEDGFPASPLLVGALGRLEGVVLPEEWVTMRRSVRRAGDVAVRPGVARALRAVVAQGRSGFYGGEFGAGLLALGAGLFTADNLERQQASWVAPLTVDAWGHRLWTTPPNSQGYLTLAAAWMASGLDLPHDPHDPRWPHLLVEAAVAAGHDRPAVLHERADGAALLDPARLGPRRDAISTESAANRRTTADRGDTTYLCVVDGDGTGVSLVQSNASGFGSHLFEPNTSINLHNRGMGFSLEPGHAAEYGPGRRPPHTLSPAFVTTTDGRLVAVTGTQGGDGQPHILLQVLARLLHGRDHDPATVIARPRFVLEGSGSGFDTWSVPDGPAVAVEDNAPPAWFRGLSARGHRVVARPAFDHGFGHAHVIVADDRGVLSGAADPRAVVGSAAGF